MNPTKPKEKSFPVWPISPASCSVFGRAIHPNGPVFSLYSIAIQEALNGAGVLMGYSALVARFAEEGALVAPFAQSVPIEQYLTVEITRNNREDGVLGRVVDLLSWG